MRGEVEEGRGKKREELTGEERLRIFEKKTRVGEIRTLLVGGETEN